MSIIGTRPPLISETNLYELHHPTLNMYNLSCDDIIPLFGKYENRKFINFAFSQSAVPARDSSQESYQY